MAAIATRFSAVYDGLRLFQGMARQRIMGTGQSGATRASAGQSGSGCPTQSWYRGQPKRGDHEKRGLRGTDGHKRVKGRKHHILVDTQGWLLNVVITAANVSDNHGFRALFDPFPSGLARLRSVLADGAYLGLRTWLWLYCAIWLTVVKRPDVKRFVVIPQRWVVERTFAWLGNFRRFSKDYDYLPSSTKAFMYIAMSSLMLRRLARY